MADHSIKIDGLTPKQYKLLMSPSRDVVAVNSHGKLQSRKVNTFVHGMHVLKNFFTRLFYAVFVTHKWESDHNLMNHLWRDLTNEKAPKNSVQIGQINRIFDSLKLRLPAGDSEKLRVEQKLLLFASKGNKPPKVNKEKPLKEVSEDVDQPDQIELKQSALDKLADRLNKKSIRAAGRHDIREKILQLLVEKKLATSDVERLLKKLSKTEDLGFINANLEIIKLLGADNPMIADDLSIVGLIHTLNTDETEYRDSIRQVVIQGRVEEELEKGAPLEHVQKIVAALTSAKDKEYLAQLLSEKVKKKSRAELA